MQAITIKHAGVDVEGTDDQTIDILALLAQLQPQSLVATIHAELRGTVVNKAGGRLVVREGDKGVGKRGEWKRW